GCYLLPTRRYPPATFKSANAATSPETPTPRFPPREKHFIATPFYTIEAQARSFEGQLLNSVTPLQLARNGFYYKPNRPFSDMAYCFAYQAFLRLGSFQPQTLHRNYIPTTATQTLAQSTPTVPTTVEKSSNANAEPHAQATPATTDPEPQQPPTPYSPQPHQTIPSIISSPQNRQTTYASVLQRPITSIPQPTPPVQELFLPAKPILTIEDLHLRFHNKPSPFQLENKTSRRSIKRPRNKPASAIQSLSRFLASAQPAFSRFLTEMQPNSDTCYPSHPQFHYSRAMRAA
ncbi:uncharacterized protein N7518_009425, partial [Penicillium psychrosexuale]|uniref:uncharacterized protein n=1 Tax=Penicillium psychrosexuale TaxID=1002107 RepID=UPI0025454F1C